MVSAPISQKEQLGIYLNKVLEICLSIESKNETSITQTEIDNFANVIDNIVLNIRSDFSNDVDLLDYLFVQVMIGTPSTYLEIYEKSRYLYHNIDDAISIRDSYIF